MLLTPPSNVVYLQKRLSKAASAFPPILSQIEIDHQESAQKRRALAVKLRAHSLVLSLICSLIGLAWIGLAWIGLAFLILAAVAWIIVWRT